MPQATAWKQRQAIFARLTEIRFFATDDRVQTE